MGTPTANPAAPVKRNRNWVEIDRQHKKRGELIVYYAVGLSETTEPPAKTGKRGHPFKYSDATIEGLLKLKVSMRLSLRATEGFAEAIKALTQGTWDVPDYSSLSYRQKSLKVDLQAAERTSGKVILMVDSTGLKVFGEGEWKVRQHGIEKKRRTWRKVHILVNRETGQIESVETTLNGVGDPTVVPDLLPEDLTNTAVLGEGAYHTKKLHLEVNKRGGVLLSPPKTNARRWGKTPTTNDDTAFEFRNKHVRILKTMDRREWKIRSGYSKRSYVESCMNRLKSITGDKLAARTLDRQTVEVRLRVALLNQTALRTARQAK